MMRRRNFREVKNNRKEDARKLARRKERKKIRRWKRRRRSFYIVAFYFVDCEKKKRRRDKKIKKKTNGVRKNVCSCENVENSSFSAVFSLFAVCVLLYKWHPVHSIETTTMCAYMVSIVIFPFFERLRLLHSSVRVRIVYIINISFFFHTHIQLAVVML